MQDLFALIAGFHKKTVEDEHALIKLAIASKRDHLSRDLITVSFRDKQKQSNYAKVFFSGSRGATFAESMISVPSVAVVAERRREPSVTVLVLIHRNQIRERRPMKIAE